jgi:hypothetical protein
MIRINIDNEGKEGRSFMGFKKKKPTSHEASHSSYNIYRKKIKEKKRKCSLRLTSATK